MVTGILGAIAALGTIFGVFKYWTQISVWLFKKTDAEKAQDIDKDVQEEQGKVDAGQRPKWD